MASMNTEHKYAEPHPDTYSGGVLWCLVHSRFETPDPPVCTCDLDLLAHDERATHAYGCPAYTDRRQ